MPGPARAQEQRRDGDFVPKSGRYARTDEYIDVLKNEWYSAKGFDHQGEFYQAENAFSAIKPFNQHLPVFFGGSSEDAIRVAGKQADVFALWGEPLASAAETVQAVKASAAQHQRDREPEQHQPDAFFRAEYRLM